MQLSIKIQAQSQRASQALNKTLFSQQPDRKISVIDAKAGRTARQPSYTKGTSEQ